MRRIRKDWLHITVLSAAYASLKRHTRNLKELNMLEIVAQF